MLSYVGANQFDLFENLRDDVNTIFEMLDLDKENQFLRRIAIKTSFSYVECIPYIMKYYLRRRLYKVQYKLNDKETTLLYEDDDYKISLLDNFKKTFKLAKKILLKEGFDLNTSGNEFKLLQKSIYVRDRITHPKKYSDIVISDVEIYNILISTEYVEKVFFGFLNYEEQK